MLKQKSFQLLINSLRKYSNNSSKQIIYSENGNPNNVLSIKSNKFDGEKVPGRNQILVKWKASPINPADINQIQGVYPVKPPLPAVGGNEGCAVVIKVGSGIEDLKCDDFVIPANAGLGTWCTHGIYDHSQIFSVDKNLDIIAASTLQVNPSTAYRMLHDFVALSKGDSVIQNGANSAVGRYVIQICRILGLKSHNIVRNGPDVDSLKRDLEELGADAVYTEEEFSNILRTNKLEAKLALNCVGGRSSLQLVRALGPEGQMITYGGMSQQPVQLPTTSLIFQNVAARGFWMSRWYERKENIQERKRMYEKIGNWYKNGELVLPPHKKWRLEQYKEAIEEATKSTQPQGAKRLKHIFVEDEE